MSGPQDSQSNLEGVFRRLQHRCFAQGVCSIHATRSSEHENPAIEKKGNLMMYQPKTSMFRVQIRFFLEYMFSSFPGSSVYEMFMSFSFAFVLADMNIHE